MRPDRGFAAITAVFVLVVLAGLGVMLVAIFGAQQRSQAFDAQGIRAYQAAHAGAEIAAKLVIANAACPASAPFQLAGAPQLSDFWVKIDCPPPTSHNDAGGSLQMFQLTVTACNSAACPGSAADNYVERQLRLTVCQGTAC
jgi:MSHA biogenesis protein MshP